MKLSWILKFGHGIDLYFKMWPTGCGPTNEEMRDCEWAMADGIYEKCNFNPNKTGKEAWLGKKAAMQAIKHGYDISEWKVKTLQQAANPCVLLKYPAEQFATIERKVVCICIAGRARNCPEHG